MVRNGTETLLNLLERQEGPLSKCLCSRGSILTPGGRNLDSPAGMGSRISGQEKPCTERNCSVMSDSSSQSKIRKRRKLNCTLISQHTFSLLPILPCCVPSFTHLPTQQRLMELFLDAKHYVRHQGSEESKDLNTDPKHWMCKLCLLPTSLTRICVLRPLGEKAMFDAKWSHL